MALAYPPLNIKEKAMSKSLNQKIKLLALWDILLIRNIKKYLEAPELSREMCYELIDRIIIGGSPKTTGKEREIDIVYKVDIASVLRHKLNK